MAGPWEQFQSTGQGPWTQFGTPVEPSPPTTGAFAAGVKSYLPQVQETFGGLKTLLGVGAERVLGEGQISRGLIESGAASMKEAEAKRQPYMTAERGSFTDALDKGVGAVLTEWLPYQAGSGAMQLLESLGLMGAGAIAGSALPGAGTLAGAGTGLVARELVKKGVKEAAEKILKEKGEDAAQAYFENEAKKAARKIGGTAAIGAQAAFYGTGQTTSRAVEEAEKLGGTATDIELARVLPAAAVSTVAEFIGDKIALGALKGIKPGEPGKFVAADLAKNILLNIGLTGTKEVPVEVIQSAAERFGAKLSLTDAQALKEYIDATAASYGMAVGPGGAGGVRQTMAERAKKPEAPALKTPPVEPPVAPPPVAPETGLEQLTPQQKQELERQRALTQRPKTTEELLAETAIQTGRPTTAQDIFRIRDEHETAVIEGLLAQDAEMARANELARRQLELESEAEATAGGISDVDARVREGRIFARVQDLIDRNIPYASTAINDINQKFGVINEAPLTEDERARVENIMGMVNTFTNFVNLPVLAPKPVDRFAENQAMEALIKERTERGPTEPLRAAPSAPSPRIEEAPVSQGVGEGAALRPTSGIEPSAAQDRQLVTPAPVAPPTATQPIKQAPLQTVDLKTGEKVSIETQQSPGAFSSLVRSQFGEPQALVAKNKDGEEIGRLTYMPNGGPIDVSVQETARRQGVATALYDAFEAQGGKLPDIESGVAISDEARAVRAARERRQQAEPALVEAAAPAAEAPTVETPAVDVAQQVKDLREQQTKLLTKSGKVPAPRSPARQKYDVLERQIAELEDRQLAVRTQKPRKPPKTIMGSPMLAGIFNKIGGLHTSLLPEFSTRFFTKKLDKKGRPVIMVRNPMIPGYGTLFNKNGKFDFGEIAEHLEEEGYLEPGSLERDYKDAGERAKELVKRALNGEEVLPIEDQIAKDNFEREASERQKALDRQEENRQIATGELQLEPEFELTDKEFEENLGLDREFETDLEMYNLEPKDLEFLSDEELESELTDAEREQAQARRTRKAEEDAARQKAEGAATGEDEALLTRPTAEGLRAKQEAAEKAAAEEKRAKAAEQERLRKEQQAKEEKARADETVKDFELGKSAEEQMTGMGDLFAAPPVPVAPPTLDTSGIKEVKGRHPQVQAAAQLLQDKKMTREEFEKYVDYYKPIQEVEAEKLLPPTSEQRMNETVNADKRDKINVPVADGTKVGLRMDLPARERGGSVVSIHEGKPGKLTVGKLMGFRSTGWLKDVTFEVRSQEKGLAVATGAAKAPQQTVEGTWFNLGPEETYARVKELMKDPAWTQVGFDPSRHGYFYDRKTREPVVSASEMYQVGQFLLAKNVKYAPKTDFLYSLGKEQTKQLQDFQQTLRNLLNRFGLKDVGLNIEEGMRDAGSYSQQLIRIASDEANPIRTLRHEAIHALRELGFFTDAQWKSLSKMAKDKWIDQYLKQRNEQGRPLKAGEESRYDAYMREYNGDMEKIIEEAVADAFADFDATKPPAGMLQALLKRMRDLFQSIKSALTKIESPEQIFGKVERGELKAGAKAEAGERKSLGKTADPGQQALETIRTMGMDVPKPDPTKLEKAKDIWTKAKEDPKLTAQSAARAMRNFLDKVETWSFSSDAKLNNDYRRAIVSDIKQNEGVIGQLLEMSQSQAVHADALASQFMIEGGLKYNDELKKWESFDAKANFPALSKKLDEIGKQYNLSKEQIERVAHAYLVAKRLPGLIERNRQLDEEITAERATAKPDKKKIQDLEDKKVFISDRQLEQMEPGLSLGKTIPELNQVVNMWNDIRKNTIDVMVNSGLWSPEYAQAMWDNMDYVPYFREDQIENEKGPQEFIRGLQVKSKEFQLKGSEDAVHDVFDNMIRWTQYAINRSVRAHKALQMIDNSKDIKIGDRKMAEKVTEEKRGMNIVRVFRDGKQELYDMADPLYVQAFAGIQNVSIPTLKFMSKISDILRNSVVLYPLFSVAQVPQDSFAAMFTSGLKTQHALKIPYLAVKEFVKTLAKTSQTHEVLKKFGATGVRDFSATVIRDDAEIYAGLKPPRGGWGKTKEFLSHISMAADNAVRQAVYEASIQQGVSRSEAIEKAFEVINFRRKGTSKMLNILGQTVPFFYAYLSAQRVAYKVLTGVGISPTDRAEAFKTLAMTSTAVATLSLLYAMANADDEDYMETPANIRDRTITIPGSGGVRIPLRPDFFLFPKIIAEHTYLLLSEQGYQDAAKFRTSMKDALISAIASPTPFPTAIKPAIEVAINYDFFQGKPLIGNFEKQKDLERQFRDSTSEFSKLLGQTGMISPIAADHLIRGMFGSFGGLFLFGTNQFLHSDPDVPRPEMNATEMLAALPGTSGLLKRPQESALKNDFYTLRDEVEKAVNTFNDIKTRSPEGMDAFLADEKQMARLMLGKSVDKINRELSKIRRQITIVTNMPESQMSAEDKADFKRQLMEMERELLRSVNVKELREMAKI